MTTSVTDKIHLVCRCGERNVRACGRKTPAIRRLLLACGLSATLLSPLAPAATIPNVPSFVSSSAFANILVDMSVETPMGGAAYADQAGNPAGCTGRSNVGGPGGGEVGACYFPNSSYLGIFDPDKCYTYSGDPLHPDPGDQFNPDGAASAHECTGGGGDWSGNFLNWANMTAIDMFIWTMTGGDRETDTAAETVLQRARAYTSRSWFPIKYVADASDVTPFSGGLYITNDDAGGYQFDAGTSRGGNQHGTFNVKVKVCDPDEGLEDNCKGYSNGGTTVYKPEGLIQQYSDTMRFGVFAYTNDSDEDRDGGVLRAPMHYVGTEEMDDDGEFVANAEKEINPDTGQIYQNPLGASGGWSGVINYINRFHRDGYKSHDPIGEMYYEAIRYLKHIGRTPEYADGASGGSFPIYTTWGDPFQFSCQKSFIVAINDANPWLDKRLPGTFFTCNKSQPSQGMPDDFSPASPMEHDCGEPSNPDSDIDVSELTDQVGDMEGLHTTWTQDNATGSDAVGYVYGENDDAGSCDDGKSVDVSHLSRVMGTCPSPYKENSYYIAGLAYYGNITDLRGDLDGTQNVNSFFIDTQEYSSTPLSGNHNMLYLAGKYGGFIDLNDNDEPDLLAEWDADSDGQPDNYVLATTPDKLVSGLQRAFNNVLEQSGSASNVTANSTQLTGDSFVFQAKFNSGTWWGDLMAYPITTSGVGATPTWTASENIPDAGSRKIYTTNSDGTAVEFLWSNLTSTDKTDLGSEDVLNYLRGVRTNELLGGGSLRDRPANNVLGDIVHSSPYYVKDTDTVYVGANDGMLHAFDGADGSELFTYIPSDVIPRLADLASPRYTHEYFVDGGIGASTTAQTPGANYIVGTLGRGGKGLFALAPGATTPPTFSAGSVKWEYFGASDDDLGYMLGRPLIAEMNDGSLAVIVGNGYNSTSGKAVLYIFDLTDGTLLKKIDTEAAGDNGLASPGVFDEDSDGKIDYIYAGDLLGNVWKFDVSDSDPDQWDVPFSTTLTGPPVTTVPAPLFVATDSGGSPQPITAPITVALDTVVGDDNNGKRFLFFGTGSYFRSTDPGDQQVQTWYGLIDEGSQISGRGDLMARSVYADGIIDGASDGPSVRVFSEAASGDMEGKSGWYIDLTDADGNAEGERIVTSSLLYSLAEPVLIASSIIPVVDPCLPGGRGYINAINPFTGGRLTQAFWDVNDNDDFTDDTLDGVPIGGIDPGVGMPSEPVLVGDRLVVGGSSGDVADLHVNTGGGATTAIRGRVSWRQIIEEE